MKKKPFVIALIAFIALFAISLAISGFFPEIRKLHIASVLFFISPMLLWEIKRSYQPYERVSLGNSIAYHYVRKGKEKEFRLFFNYLLAVLALLALVNLIWGIVLVLFG